MTSAEEFFNAENAELFSAYRQTDEKIKFLKEELGKAVEAGDDEKIRKIRDEISICLVRKRSLGKKVLPKLLEYIEFKKKNPGKNGD